MKLALLLLAGCVDYAHTSLHNAPGKLDLDEPIAHENGDPERFQPAKSPGQHTLAVFTMPYVMAGVGRTGAGGEAGLEMRFEHTDQYLLADQTFAITAGIPSLQWSNDHTIAGAFYAELSYRFPIVGIIPLDIGLGPAGYTSNRELGGQLSLRIPFVLLRFRYLPESRFEVMAGAELPFTFFFSRSR